MSHGGQNCPQLRTPELQWRRQYFHSTDKGYVPDPVQTELGTTEGLCPRELALNPGLLAQVVFDFKTNLSPHTDSVTSHTLPLASAHVSSLLQPVSSTSTHPPALAQQFVVTSDSTLPFIPCYQDTAQALLVLPRSKMSLSSIPILHSHHSNVDTRPTPCLFSTTSRNQKKFTSLGPSNELRVYIKIS